MSRIKNIKNQFPIFKNLPDLIYLDNAATTQKPQEVLDAQMAYYTTYCANIYRGIYSIGEQATQSYEDARAAVAQFIGAHQDEVVFVKNATEGINLVAWSWARAHLAAGDHILLTEYEHHANLLPWQVLAKDKGIIVDYLPVKQDGHVNYDALEQLISARTKLIACCAVNHVTGAYTDIKKIIAAARTVQARVLLDAAQLVAHERINVKELDVDFVVFSGHKLFGPTGIGVLYIKKDLALSMSPYQVGGGAVFDVDFEHAIYAPSPHKFEAGTPPIAQAIGLAQAIRWFIAQDIVSINMHERALMRALVNGLSALPHIRIIGDLEQLKVQAHIVSFIVDGIHAHDVAAYLNLWGIAVRAGHHCAQPLAKKLGIEASVRVSVACYNTMQDIVYLLEKLTVLTEQKP